MSSSLDAAVTGENLLHQQADHTMDHTHHPVSQSHRLPLDCLDDELQEDHPEEVRVGESYVARGGGDVWEGRLGRDGQVEHPANSLQSYLSLRGGLRTKSLAYF